MLTGSWRLWDCSGWFRNPLTPNILVPLKTAQYGNIVKFSCPQVDPSPRTTSTSVLIEVAFQKQKRPYAFCSFEVGGLAGWPLTLSTPFPFTVPIQINLLHCGVRLFNDCSLSSAKFCLYHFKVFSVPLLGKLNILYFCCPVCSFLL